MFPENYVDFTTDERSKRPLSVYIHIPFCVKKCLYCDFLSMSASAEIKDQYAKALEREIKCWADLLAGQYRIETIFIGGGTPTCMTAEQMKYLGEALNYFMDRLEVHPCLEFSMEANPGTMMQEHLLAMKIMGVNRVSLGVQSAQDAELKLLGRIHSYTDVLVSVQMLREAGFDNINLDIMADIPGQTFDSYKNTLEKIMVLQPEHISAYSLIIEEGTPFYQMNEEGKLELLPEEMDRKMYQWTKHILKDAGYERYEFSNYAKTGKECRHNLTYWSMGEYLGIGLGASSYMRGCRFRGIASLEQYLNQFLSEKKWKPDDFWLEDIHRQTKRDEMEEFVFLGLRKTEGISLSEYEKRFGIDFYKVYDNILPKFFSQGLLAENANRDRIYLTDHGIDVSNLVLSDFLLSDA